MGDVNSIHLKYLFELSTQRVNKIKKNYHGIYLLAVLAVGLGTPIKSNAVKTKFLHLCAGVFRAHSAAFLSS